MQILKYLDREGGKWITPTGEFTEDDILSMPRHKTYRGDLWGFVHAYVREDGKRFDASNDEFERCNPRNTATGVAFDSLYNKGPIDFPEPPATILLDEFSKMVVEVLSRGEHHAVKTWRPYPPSHHLD